VIRRERIEVRTPGRGLHEITDRVVQAVAASGVSTGLAHLFLQHTSASLVVQENADPTARLDLERWFDDLAPDGDRRWTHRSEGPDDMPSHVRAAVTTTELTVPVEGGRPALGTWQGIWIFEHRTAPHRRRIVLTVSGE